MGDSGGVGRNIVRSNYLGEAVRQFRHPVKPSVVDYSISGPQEAILSCAVPSPMDSGLGHGACLANETLASMM